MSTFSPDNPNAEQIEYWNGEAGQGWAERDQQMEKTLHPIGEEAMAVASVQTGQTVLDVGCGCGRTTCSLLEKVGPGGRVLGVDISGPMLEAAAATASELPPELRPAIAFEHADASEHAFEPATFDLAFSRFGVMFFADPAAAFANIRSALKPGGRLAFVCWAPAKENEWVSIPLAAALRHVPPPEPMPPNAPGPFGLADRAYVQQVLTEAGYVEIDIASFRPTMRFGHGMQRERVADFFIDAGPVSRLLAGAAPDIVRAARRDIAEAIMPRHDGETVNLGASCWVVSASNGTR